MTAAAVILTALLWGIFVVADPERKDLDSSVRSSAPGQFVQLSDGYTHFEIGGPGGGRVVVLAAGFSVPYYIWDPTFKALVDAGFRVLRYDYYGRGFSDRPAVPFKDDLYVRQLDELLKATQITQPVDLVGISFGGSLITNFADKYPGRVRTLIYFDPSIRRPYTLSLIESVPPLWNYLTATLDERTWADSQMGDFLRPEHFPDWPKRYREQMQFKGFRRARFSEMVSNTDVDQSDQFKRVAQHPRPVLVIWGKQDNTVPFEESEWMMKTLTHGKLVAVEGSGHLPQWEKPDDVHPALIEFLRNAGVKPATTY